MENFNKERKSFMEKIEEIKLNVIRSEKEIFTLKQKIQQLDEQNASKDETIASLKRDLQDEKSSLKRKYEAEKQE
jgi:hypothetical protein